MKRRDFIKTSFTVTSGAFFVNSVLGCVNPMFLETDSLDEIYRGFQKPPISSQVFVRWWWNGNRITKNEILRELDIMKAAGIGGVEINPIEFPIHTDPVDYKALTIFDNEWLEMLEIALKGAKERGLVCDMIVGSGWPFGGEFLKKEQQSQMVTIETIELNGGKNYKFKISELIDKVNPEILSKNENFYKDLLLVRLAPKNTTDFIQGVDITPDMANNELSVDVPEGSYVLYYVVKLTGFLAVIKGAPGAKGPVLNHYSKEATQYYLNTVSGHIAGKIGNMGNYIRAMFCDSMELEGANWNDDLPVEFEKRRGYSLIPYLPFVLKKIGHMGNPIDEQNGTKFSDSVIDKLNRVDLDFYLTRIELFKERFTDTFNDWCHANNVKSRMQAYGRGLHPLEASMDVDIPEGETWMFNEIGKEYPITGLIGRAPRMCNKYVSSAAALSGKKIVSCEELTNTAEVFMATLENIKIAGDQSNISGTNHSILHGFNFSPPEAKFPGWVRYGTYFNEHNTWWPYFKKWSDYKARVSYILQSSSPQANVAILQPLTDLWLKMGPQRDPFPKKWYPEYQNNLWEAVHQNGGGCDYVSENIIKESNFNNGKMIFNARSYSTLLIPEIETLDFETTKKLVEFVGTGGKIIFIAKKPFKSPTYINNDAAVKDLVDEISKSKNAILYPAPKENIIHWYGQLQDEIKLKPYVRFDKTHKYLNQSSHRIENRIFFFIANSSLTEHISVKADFDVSTKYNPWIWNPETGERLIYPTEGENNILQLELPRATSIIIVFEPTNIGNGKIFNLIHPKTDGSIVTGGWKLSLNHINGNKKKMDLETLTDLVEIKETKEFAGEVIYKKTITIDSENYKYIDLGVVHGISELTINGVLLGAKWYGSHLYAIDKLLKKGENKLSIKLTTVIGNYVKSLTDNKVAVKWTKNQKYNSAGILGPIRMIE